MPKALAANSAAQHLGNSHVTGLSRCTWTTFPRSIRVLRCARTERTDPTKFCLLPPPVASHVDRAALTFIVAHWDFPTWLRSDD